MSAPVERLAELPLFAHFAPEQLDSLADCSRLTRFAPGTVVVAEGSTSAEAFVIDHGKVRIKRDTPYGTFELALLAPGALFGEASIVDGGPRSVDALAEGEVDLLVLDGAAIAARGAHQPRFELAVYWTFWKSLSDKLRATNERLGRFFSETGQSSGVAPPPADEPTGTFRLDLAQKQDLFSEQSLSRMEINFLASLSKEQRYKAGEVLFREGDPGDAMYIVLEGRVRIGKQIPGAGEEALAFLERGAYFGEMALIDNEPRSAEATAHDGGAVVLRIPRDVVLGLLDIRKVSSLRLLKILSRLVAKRLREIDEKIVGWFILSGGQGGAL